MGLATVEESANYARKTCEQHCTLGFVTLDTSVSQLHMTDILFRYMFELLESTLLNWRIGAERHSHTLRRRWTGSRHIFIIGLFEHTFTDATNTIGLSLRSRCASGFAGEMLASRC